MPLFDIKNNPTSINEYLTNSWEYKSLPDDLSTHLEGKLDEELSTLQKLKLTTFSNDEQETQRLKLISHLEKRIEKISNIIRNESSESWHLNDTEFPLAYIAGKVWILSKDIIGEGHYSNCRLAIPYDSKNKTYKELENDSELCVVKSLHTKSEYTKGKEGLKLMHQMYSSRMPIYLQEKDIDDLSCHHIRVKSESEGTYVLQALLPGSVKDYLNNPDLSPEARLKLIISAAKALNELHQKYKIAHLDFKDDNFQYDTIKDKAYIIDLDFGHRLDEADPSKLIDQIYVLGEGNGVSVYKAYAAPERQEVTIDEDKKLIKRQYNASTDIYAFAGFIIRALGSSEKELTANKRNQNTKAEGFNAPYVVKLKNIIKLFKGITDTPRQAKSQALEMHALIMNLSHKEAHKRPSNLNDTIAFFEKLLLQIQEKNNKTISNSNSNSSSSSSSNNDTDSNLLTYSTGTLLGSDGNNSHDDDKEEEEESSNEFKDCNEINYYNDNLSNSINVNLKMSKEITSNHSNSLNYSTSNILNSLTPTNNNKYEKRTESINDKKETSEQINNTNKKMDKSIRPKKDKKLMTEKSFVQDLNQLGIFSTTKSHNEGKKEDTIDFTI